MIKGPIRHLSREDIAKFWNRQTEPGRRYLAMYSSWYGGIVVEPELMTVPIDDHIVHRGDGVFEAIKCVDGNLYGLDRHLERLEESAQKIFLAMPCSRAELRELAIETTRAAAVKDCLLRLYLSRGPGGFTANPYESVGTQVYLVVTPGAVLPSERFTDGVKVKLSRVPVKMGFLAHTKSCNYLPNVLMRKEAIDAGVDFTISEDEKGFLAEGSTENFAIVSSDGDFLVPGFERTLRGVTAVRVMELAQKWISDSPPGGKSLIREVKNACIRRSDVEGAREAMLLGTTLDVLPVTTFEGFAIGDGCVGPVCRRFLELLREDMCSGPLVTKISPY